MLRLNLPSFRFSAPIVHSAMARSGSSVGWSFASTVSPSFWTRQRNNNNNNNSKYNNNSIKNNNMLREIQKTAKLVGIASSSSSSSSSTSSSDSFPFLSTSSNKGTPSRFLLRKYQVCDLLAPSHSTPIISATLFNSKCFRSTPSTSAASQVVASGTKITTKPGCETSVDKFYFNLPVIKHMLTEVSKNPTLKAVFEATECGLAGPSPPQIDKNNIASRYDNVAKELKKEKPTSKKKVLIAVSEALPTFKAVVPTIFGHVQSAEYPLLLATIFLLRSFASHEPRITAASMSSQLLPGLTPFSQLGQLGFMLATEIWSDDDNRDGISTALITSTFAKAQKLDDARKQLLPEIIRSIIDVHDRQEENDLGDQCRFVRESHTTVACTEIGKGVCASRFVNSNCGAGLTNSFQVQWSPKNNESNRGEFFDSDIVNIVTGSSGSGKTISSLICDATAGKPVYCLLLHTALDCIKMDLADVDPKEKDDRDDVAFTLLKNGILKIMAPPDDQKNVSPSRQAFTSVANWNGVLRIVVDEIGFHPVFLRALCAGWQSKRSKLARFLGVHSDHLQLVAVGTGADNFELSRLGSVKASYKVLTVARNNELFKKLFVQKMKRMNGKTELPPALQLYQLLFGANPDLPDRVVPEAILPSPTTDPVFRALLRLVTNARCAAIVVFLMHESFVGRARLVGESTTTEKNRSTKWSIVQFRATVSYWCVESIDVYCSMNALSSLDERQRHYSIGQAIAYDLNRSLVVKGNTERERANEWELYGVRFGLLSDTAREMKEKDSAMQEIFTQKWTDSSDNKTKRQQQFGIPVGTSRFVVDDAFVTMFLIMSGTDRNDVFAKNHTNVRFLFEEAMFDYQRIASQFGHRHPVPLCGDSKQVVRRTKKSASTDAEIVLSAAAKVPPSKVAITHDADGFTPPHLLYGLGCNTVYSARLSFKLEEKAIKVGGNVASNIAPSARMWRAKIEQGAAIVLLNGDNANCADIITLAPNRIIFTQCKNGKSINAKEVDGEIRKMRCKELLGLLCWCVDTTRAKNPVEIFYVLAGGDKKAFCPKTVKTQKDNDISATNNQDSEWPMMPLDSKKCVELNTSVFGKKVIKYRLHESIHFTYAYSDEAFPYSPVLRSRLPVPGKTADGDYSCMTRVEYADPYWLDPCGDIVSSIMAAPEIHAQKDGLK